MGMRLSRVDSRLPIGGKQRIDLTDFYDGQAAEDIGEVILRIDAAAPATDQDGVNNGTAPTSIGMSNEEPSFAANGRGTDGVFDQVVIDLESPIAEISRQRIIIIEEVADRLTECAFR